MTEHTINPEQLIKSAKRISENRRVSPKSCVK